MSIFIILMEFSSLINPENLRLKFQINRHSSRLWLKVIKITILVIKIIQTDKILKIDNQMTLTIGVNLSKRFPNWHMHSWNRAISFIDHSSTNQDISVSNIDFMGLSEGVWLKFVALSPSKLFENTYRTGGQCAKDLQDSLASIVSFFLHRGLVIPAGYSEKCVLDRYLAQLPEVGSSMSLVVSLMWCPHLRLNFGL